MRADLVAAAQQGDQRAFEALAEAALDRLYAAAALILHDRTLAEDAVQEALVRAWRSLPRLRDPDRFDAWMRSILVHACMDVVRSERGRRVEREIPMDLPDGDDFASLAADRDEVVRAFRTLSPGHRAAFVLRHLDDLTVPEVAEALHVPLGTAKSRIHYAERAMAAAMNHDQEAAAQGGLA